MDEVKSVVLEKSFESRKKPVKMASIGVYVLTGSMQPDSMKKRHAQQVLDPLSPETLVEWILPEVLEKLSYFSEIED